MSADCPGCWPTPKLPITRVRAHHDACPQDLTPCPHGTCPCTYCQTCGHAN